MESLAKRRKDLRLKHYLNAVDRDLSIPDFEGFKKCHNTRQHGNLFVPTIDTNAFLQSFQPRTSLNMKELPQSKLVSTHFSFLLKGSSEILFRCLDLLSICKCPTAIVINEFVS